MQLKSVSSREEYRSIEKIYLQSFPENERAPMKLLKKRAKQGKADFLAAYDGEKIVGMAYVVCMRDLAYLFYIAVDKSERGKGYGTQTMAALLKQYSGKRFFFFFEQLDSSADNYSQRVKRHSFYSACGLHDLPFKLKEGAVTFAAMGKLLTEGDSSQADGFTVSAQEYGELMRRFMGFIMSRIVDVRLLP